MQRIISLTVLSLPLIILCNCSDEPMRAVESMRALAPLVSASPYVAGVGSNQCMDVAGGTALSGTAVQLYTCNGTAAQSWSYANGALSVITNRCLSAASSNAGAALSIVTCQSGAALQQWTRQGATFALTGTNLCATVPNGQTSNGTLLQLATCNASTSQQWAALGTTTASKPYAGSPYPVGRIEAENFDLGGAGVAYHTFDNINHGNAYRTQEGVSIFAQSNASNGYKVGWVSAGEWLNYTVAVSQAGRYTLTVSAASVGGGQTVHFDVDGQNSTGMLTLPNTGSAWGVFQSTTSPAFTLSAGTHVVRFVADADAHGNGVELDDFDLTLLPSTTTGTSTGGSSSTTTTTGGSSTTTTTTTGGSSTTTTTTTGGSSTTTTTGGSSTTTSTGGSSTTTGGSTTPTNSYNYTIPQGRGANVPYVEFQAENAATNAQIIGPSRLKWDANHIEAEAIGRKAVKLVNTSDYVEFTTTAPANALVVRFSIPDAPSGGGINATLGVYVNGVRTTLNLTSKYSWSYNGGTIGSATVDVPGPQPHTFFDEAHIGPRQSPNLGQIASGSKVRLQRDAQDTAAFYIIDLVDFEQVAAPLAKPSGFTDVTTLGVFPDDGIDDAQAILNLLQGHTGQKYFFPAGTYGIENFNQGVGNAGIDNLGNEVAGAGMWYTTLAGKKGFFCDVQAPCNYHDLAIFGDSVARDEETAGLQKAFAGPLGVGSQLYNLWIEHEVGAIWVGNDPPYQTAPTQNLHIHDTRIRNTYADGINLDDGTSYSLIENTTMRNTGDDAAVVWSINWPLYVEAQSYLGAVFTDAQRSAPGAGAAHGNIFRNITVQMPWRANCFAAYGGYDNHWVDSVCEDVLTYPGAFIDREFQPYPFGSGNAGVSAASGVTSMERLSILRGGGQMFNENTADPWYHGAVKIYTREGSISDVLISNVDILDPTYAGIEFRGYGAQYAGGAATDPNLLTAATNAKLTNVSITNVNVYNAGTNGILVLDLEGNAGSQVNGSVVNFNGVNVVNASGAPLSAGNVPATFFNRVTSNTGW